MKLSEAFASQDAKSQLFKFLVVGIILILAVFFDQWSKNWAENNLASNRYAEHYVTVTVDSAAETPTLADFVAKKYPKNSEIENKRIMAFASTDGIHLNPQDELKDGQIIDLRNVGITVIDGYYDYQYARNPGAAFSFLADKSPTFRSVFFGITGILAIILILVFIGASSWKTHKPMIIALACVLGGALGNVIDRARLSYVIDFVSWHIGDRYYWPTFNIADVFVTCGVAFLVLDMIINRKKYDDKAVDDKSGEKKETKAIEAKESESVVVDAKDEEKAEAVEAKAEEPEAKAETAEAEAAEDKEEQAPAQA
ncbi:MAG: signal peptidase II [Proteobacteria bacterium]|nr:signal peptidase II [Pseudomonadota bacterium]